MTKKYCDSPIHKVSSLALAFIILAFCVFPSFVHADSVRPNEPVGWKDGDTFRDILLVVLDSWGISFSKSDSSDTTSILDYSDQLMQEFYEDNETTQELFWDLVKYGADETGNLILDFLGVNKIRQFANWLVNKYSLQDNSSVNTVPVLETVYSLDGYPCFLVPFSFTGSRYYTGISSSSYVPVYAFVVYTDSNESNIGFVPFAKTPNNFTFTVTTSFLSTDYTASYHSGSYTFLNPQGHYNLPYGRPSPNYILPYSFANNLNNLSSFFASAGEVTNNGPSYDAINITIVTQTIDIPSEDMDPDDGLRIEIPGTNWGDSIFTILDLIERLISLYDSTKLNVNTVIELITTLLQGLQSSVTVENIPGAVILDYDDYDIPLENEWGLFDIFFNTDDDTTILSPWQDIRAIIYGFPSPILSFFALVVLFVVAYGFIRMGRDSH